MQKVAVAVFLAIVLSLGGGLTAFAAGMQIFVAMPSGVVITLDVDSSDSIENVRQKVQDQTSIAPDQQLLSLAGVELEDGRTLADYAIQNGNTVQLGYVRALALVSPVFPPFVLDAAYTATIVAAPAFSPLVFALTAGALPAGINFDPATGTFAGSPTTAGAYAFTITATRDDGTALAIPFAGSIAPAAAVADPPGDPLVATGLDPAGPLGLAGALVLAGALTLFGRRRRRA